MNAINDEFAARIENCIAKPYRAARMYLDGDSAAADAVDEAVYRAFRYSGQYVPRVCDGLRKNSNTA